MLVNRAESHTSGARFVGQPACWPKRWIKTEPPPTWLDFTRNFAFYQNPKKLCWPKRLLKKTNFTLSQNNCWNEEIFYADQNTCWERVTFTFTKTCAEKRQADFENLQSQPRTPREKNDTANQNHRRPKRKRKTLKPILATGQNQPEFMPAKKTPPNENAENLKTCLLKNIWPKTLFWKVSPSKQEIYFYELKTATLKNDFNPKTKLANQRRIWFCSWVAQRFALPACGWAWTMFEM